MASIKIGYNTRRMWILIIISLATILGCLVAIYYIDDAGVAETVSWNFIG